MRTLSVLCRSTVAMVAWSGLFLPVAGECAKPPADAIGINLGPFYPGGEQIPFIDVFKMSAFWTLHSKDHPERHDPPKLDENGWIASLQPGEYAETNVFHGSSGHYPTGKYTLTYVGKGELLVSGDGVTVVSTTPGHIVIDVKPVGGAPDNGIDIRESRTDPAAPIRSIRLLLPGFSAEPADNPFNPAFLAVLKPFKVIRFIGWAHVNRSETQDWADARPKGYATQASGLTSQRMSGVALEYQIALANLLHKDPWFLVPLKATDDYVRHMAALVQARLDPSLHPYVELSNEVWNAGFSEAAYARGLGTKEGLDPDPVKAGAKWYTGQALHVFGIWKETYGEDAGRIVRVLGGAFPLPPLTNVELTYQDAYKEIDAFAVAPYINPRGLKEYDAAARMTEDQVLDLVEADVTGKFKDFMGYHLAYTKKYTVDLVAYEGGPSLMSAGAPSETLPHIQATLNSASHSQRMANIYGELLHEWFALGGKLFNHFDDCSAPGPWGNFGLIDYQDQNLREATVFNMLISDAVSQPKSQ